MKNFIRIIASGVLLFFSANAFAGQIQPITGILRASGTTTIHVGDSVAISQTHPTSGIADYDVVNIVSLNFDNTSTKFFGSPTSVRIALTIKRWDATGAAMTPVNTSLTVNTDSRYNRQTVDQETYRLTNGYHIQTVIDSINGSTTDTLPHYVYIEEEIQMQRYYQYSGAAASISSIDTLNTDCDEGNIIDELRVNWGTVTGAEEYQLEWTYVNNYGRTDSTSSLPQSVLYADFKNNSTRITTAFVNYRITLAYERGYIAFRVRPVGRDYLHPDQYIYGAWTTADYVTVSSISSTSKYYNYHEHERLKNWQYSATFAEEGKKKEVISYFDGSLHNRQSVTKVNSDKNVIVGETVYDYQGRPAINILPTPVPFASCGDPFTSEPALKYYTKYNKDTLGRAYSKMDFDSGGVCNTTAFPMDTVSGSSQYYSGNNPNKVGFQAFVPDALRFPFSQVEYTPDNTGRIRSQSGVGKTFQLGGGHETKYIYSSPNQIQLDRLFGSEAGDAHHYKKNTVTDANGQISISYLNQEGKTIATSLAGDPPTYMQALSSDSTAAVPFRVDAFEKDAGGFSSSNTINPMEDGIEFSTQLSVSYTSAYSFNYDLSIDTINVHCLKSGFCMSCIYDLEIKITDECGADITVSSGESNPINKRVGHLNDSLGFTMICAGTSLTTESDSLKVNLTPGVYTVSKILTLNTDARNFYLKNYLDSTYNTCIKTKYTFIDSALAHVDTSACSITCASCAAALGTKDDFVASGRGTDVQYDFLMEQCLEPCRDKTLCESTYDMMLVDVSPGGQYGKFNATTVDASGEGLSIFNEANVLPCNKTSSGNANWRHPILTLSGHPYYFYLNENGERTKITVTLVSGTTYNPAVHNSALVYTDTTTGNQYTFPENLANFSDFVSNWNDYFAHSLVIYHPEFAYYVACKDQSRIMSGDSISTETMDSLLMETNTFADAVAKGFINPSYLTISDPNSRVYDWTASSLSHKYDPFFANPTPFNTFYGPFASPYPTISAYSAFSQSSLVSQMSYRMSHYLMAGTTPYTMIEAAAMGARCGNIYTTAITAAPCSDFGKDFYPSTVSGYVHLNDSIRDREWLNLKNFYISEKRKLQFKRMDYFALHIASSLDLSMPSSDIMGGCNACIGNSSFNPYTSGFYSPFSMFGFSAPAYDVSQPCSLWNVGNFPIYAKRFVDPANMGLDASTTPYQVYQQTGQCPMGFELMNFLNAMTQGHYLYPSSIVALGSVGAFGPDLYNAIAPSGSAYKNYSWQTGSVSSGVLTVNLVDTIGITPTTECTIKLDISGTPIADHTKILSLQNLTYNGAGGSGDDFQVWATYLIGSGPGTATVQISGSSCFKIHGCEFEPTCSPNDLAQDFLNLENLMKINGVDGNTNFSLSSNSHYAPALTTTIRNTLGTPNSHLMWNFVSPNHVQIYDSTNTSTKLVFTTISFSPSTALSHTVAYGNIRSNYNNLYKMDALDTLGNKIADVDGIAVKIVGTDTTALSMGECGMPPTPDCSSKEHKVRTDLEELLNQFLTVKPFVGNVNLYAEPGFTPLLKSYFSDTLTLTTGTYHYNTGDTTSYDTLTINTHNSCNFQMYHNIHYHAAHAVNFGDMIAVSNLTGVPPLDADGNYHDFYFVGTFYKASTTYTDTVRGTSCLPLKNCGSCNPGVTELVRTEKVPLFGFGSVGSYYSALQTIIDSYNSSPYALYHHDTIADPDFGKYVYVIDHSSCYSDYETTLNIYIHAPYDTTLSLPHDTCIVEYTDNCDSLYIAYVDAVINYDTFAASHGITSIPKIENVANFKQYYCSCSEKFIAGLTALMNGLPLTSANSDQLLKIGQACNPIPTAACSTPDTAFTFPPVPYSPNPCVVQALAAATQNALNQYNEYVDSVTTSFVSQYNYHCLHPVENLFYKYTDKEYHFTKYYYDQAGNLVKTVPPEGVEFLNINSDTSALEIMVKNDRANNTHAVFTSDRMATTYLYNSLNQLTRQDMPDHDKMDICESIAPNGLDADLFINSEQFVNANQGYLTGYVYRTIGGTPLQRGYVYSTNDGGQNWSRVTGVAAGDLQKIQMVSSSVGYAVSNYGMIFKTLDGGFSWDASTTLYNNTHQYFGTLNDLYFTSTSTGVVGGIYSSSGAGIYETTDGGVTFAAATGFATNDTITGFTNDGTNYYATVKNGCGKTYYSSSGASWTQLKNYAANDLKKVQFINNDTAFAVGYDGTLLRSNAADSVWTLLATNSPYKFSDVFFKNGKQGIALVDSVAGKAKIYKTLNGGNTWTLLSDAGKYYSSLQAYDPHGGKVIAAGTHGLVTKVLMDSAPFGTIPISSNLASVADNLNYAQAISVSGKLPSLTVSNSDTVYFNYDVQTANWSPLVTTVSGGFKKGLISVASGLSPITKGILLGNDGVVYSFYRPYNSAPTVSAVSVTGGPSFSDITCSDSANIATFYGYDKVNKKIYSFIYSGTTPVAAAITGAVTPTINSITLSNNGKKMIIAGQSGAILVTTSLPGTSVTWKDYTNKVVPLPLNDIEQTTTATITAVGNDGTQWYSSNSGANWSLAVNGTAVKLNSIRLDNTAKGLIAGNNGNLFAVSSAMSLAPTLTSVSTGLTDNLTDVALQNSGVKAFATSQGGKAIYVSDYTAPSTGTVELATNTNGALNGISFMSTGGSALAVGNKAGVLLYSGTSGFLINDIYTSSLKSVHFFDSNNGYVVDSGYVLRHTTNGGNTWNVVLPDASLPVIAKVYTAAVNKAIVIGASKYVAQINNESIPASLTVPSGITSDFKDIKFNANGYGVIVGSNAWAASIVASGATYTVGTIGQVPWGGFTFNAVHVFSDMNDVSHTHHFIAAGASGNIYYYKAGTGYVSQHGYTGYGSGVVFNGIYFHDDRTGYVVGDAGIAIKCSLITNAGETGSELLTINQSIWQGLCPNAIYLGRTSTSVNFKTIAFSTRSNGFLAGNYNSTGIHRHAALINDESELYSTRFWYDRLGRMVVSQNTKQYNRTPKSYSYTLYDQLGRIEEVGEKYENTTASKQPTIFGTLINGFLNLQAIDDTKLLTWVKDATGARKEVTSTYFDNQLILPTSYSVQNNLRKRVASVTYEDVFDNDSLTYQSASHFDYDIHGNVSTLWQENKKLYDTSVVLSSSLVNQRYKRIDYDFDLISGKVNQVTYQKDSADQFMHRYTYDADNRITTAETSTDDAIWDLDAKYFYYAHGPLARVEYGTNSVQGIDYAYTLQGWIKGVNSNTLNEHRDMGRDADTASSNPNKFFAKDAYGYSLNYFKNDYKAIDYVKWNTVSNRFEANAVGSEMESHTHDLFNGNIKSMVSTIEKIDTAGTGLAKAPKVKPLGNAYKYDQLNRLNIAVAFDSINLGTNIWGTSGATPNMYRNVFAYDANGNILSQKRSDETGTQFDSLQYKYKRDLTTGKMIHNRLYNVNDNTGYTTAKTDDIDDQGTFNANLTNINVNNNYNYDEIGNLKKDSVEEISNIEWTFFGKIKSITRLSTSTKDNLVFDYDASGNQIAKHVFDASNNWKYTTYYIRDGQGNVLSVYDQKIVSSTMSYKLIEQDLFGSSRIGLNLPEKEIIGATTSSIIYHVLGKKQYELTNYLGNVLTTLTDRKIPVDSNADGIIDHYIADIQNASDYSVFGVKLYNRGFEFSNCRYGFNGKEKLDELHGNSGDTYDYGMRTYDARLGRFMSVDPLFRKYPELSTYQFASNSPIQAIDLDGLEKLIIMDKQNFGLRMVLILLNHTQVWRQFQKDIKDPAINPEKRDVYISTFRSIQSNGDPNPLIFDKNGNTTNGDYGRTKTVTEKNALSYGISDDFSGGKKSEILLINNDIFSFVAKNLIKNTKAAIQAMKMGALTLFHEGESHSLDDMQGDKNTTVEDHQKFYGNGVVLDGENSPNYQDVDPIGNSPASTGKRQIESGGNKIQKIIEKLKSRKK